jgi:hypothetical protein
MSAPALVRGPYTAPTDNKVPLHTPTLYLGLAAILALALALRLPAATTVLGLAAFGVLHNVLELRYVAGRFEAVLAGPFLLMLGALVTGVLVCRLLPPGPGPRTAEIGLSYVLLAVACVRVFGRGRRWWLAGSLGVLATAATASFAFPAYHFVVLTHLHNVVPLFFLWEWSRSMTRAARWPFRAVNLGWVIAVPGLILAGAFDPLVRAAPAALAGFGGVAAFEPTRMAAAYAPPAVADGELGMRFLAVFAFMQTMHYVIWVAVLPRFAPEAAKRFDRRVPVLRGRRAWVLGLGLAAVLGVLFAVDYAQGRTLYAAVASYHAYLEFPVLLALIFGRVSGTTVIPAGKGDRR